MNRDSAHCAAVESVLFSGGRTESPAWLLSSIQNCQSRYAGLSLTTEFDSAIKSLDDHVEPKPFELFVVGEGKFGKSTLVNCLLGEELSRVRVLPETRCFLRYVLKDQPSSFARFFVRRKKGTHDWLKDYLDEGQPAPSIYNVHEHRVDLRLAKEILAKETQRLDAGAYEAAVLEVERDVRRSPRSAFNEEVRVVDTQGLDQLFPDEIKQQAVGLAEASSTQLFMDWMSNSPRGKYLEWQFRRCDAVLWCVNSKRIGSAATAAALRYFSSYSKKIVIALTNVDLVAKRDSDLQRLMKRAWELYGSYAVDICPVNGQGAWEAIVSGDPQEVQASGFAGLVERLRTTCISQGRKVRNLSRYFAVRTTELQYRRSLRQLHADYRAIELRYQRERREIGRARDKSRAEVSTVLRQQFKAVGKDVLARIRTVTLADDQNDAQTKIGADAAARVISATVSNLIETIVIPAVVDLGNGVEPYALPAFDADGQASGSCLRIEFDRPNTGWRDVHLAFHFSLASMWGMHAMLKIRELFGSDRARAERRFLERQRHDELSAAFEKAWESHEARTIAAVGAEVDRLYGELIAELDGVYERIETSAGGDLTAAQSRIAVALKDLAVRPAISTVVRGAVMSRVAT